MIEFEILQFFPITQSENTWLLEIIDYLSTVVF